MNDTFRIELGSGVSKIKLIEISDHSNDQMESFSILFRSTENIIKQQNTYNLEHKDLGKFPLFLVPAKKGAQGFYYEAVFTRSLRK